jgi:hypothetical protein
MTASGGLIALAAAAIVPVVSRSLRAARVSRLSMATPTVPVGSCAAVASSIGVSTAALTVPSDIADVFEMWLKTVYPAISAAAISVAAIVLVAPRWIFS